MLTFRQVNNIVRNDLRIVSGCEFDVQETSGEVLYTVYINTDSGRVSLGIYRVWEWHDGSGRCDWMHSDNTDPEIERFRNFIWNMISTDAGRAEKESEKSINGQPATVETVQPLNTISDRLGGALTYRYNEQGQTIITGGTANPGYVFEIGRNIVAIKAERTDNTSPVFGDTNSASPKWKTIIPNKGDDWQILELWEKNHTNSEIGERLRKAPRTITNRISALRLRYPNAGIPKNDERRKRIQKS